MGKYINKNTLQSEIDNALKPYLDIKEFIKNPPACIKNGNAKNIYDDLVKKFLNLEKEIPLLKNYEERILALIIEETKLFLKQEIIPLQQLVNQLINIQKEVYPPEEFNQKLSTYKQEYKKLSNEIQIMIKELSKGHFHDDESLFFLKRLNLINTKLMIAENNQGVDRLQITSEPVNKIKYEGIISKKQNLDTIKNEFEELKLINEPIEINKLVKKKMGHLKDLIETFKAIDAKINKEMNRLKTKDPSGANKINCKKINILSTIREKLSVESSKLSSLNEIDVSKIKSMDDFKNFNASLRELKKVISINISNILNNDIIAELTFVAQNFFNRFVNENIVRPLNKYFYGDDAIKFSKLTSKAEKEVLEIKDNLKEMKLDSENEEPNKMIKLL